MTKSLPILALIAICMFACDSFDDLTLVGQDGVANALLAPPKPAQRVYVTPATMEFHLSSPRCLLGLEKYVLTVGEAEAEGYTGCYYCFPELRDAMGSYVYILDSGECYHRAGCPGLDDSKTAIAKTQAVEEGYEACPVCTQDIRISGGLVYVTVTGMVDGIYHTNINCKHLDHLNVEEKAAIAQSLRSLEGKGVQFRECLDCGEERHTEDE